MDRPDQVVPIGHGRELFDPWFAAREPIALHADADRDAASGMVACPLNPCEVGGHFGLIHAPVVEWLWNLRGVVGDAIFGQPSGQGGIDKSLGIAHRMAAKWRVSVVISRHETWVGIGLNRRRI